MNEFKKKKKTTKWLMEIPELITYEITGDFKTQADIRKEILSEVAKGSEFRKAIRLKQNKIKLVFEARLTKKERSLYEKSEKIIF